MGALGGVRGRAYLRFVVAVAERLGVEVPESDYPLIRTLDGCVAYLTRRGVGAPAQRASQPVGA